MFLTCFLFIWGSLGYSILPLFSAAEGSPGGPAPLDEEAAFERAGVLQDRCLFSRTGVLTFLSCFTEKMGRPFHRTGDRW